jgi:predicted O-methyltransferase YrrM
MRGRTGNEVTTPKIRFAEIHREPQKPATWTALVMQHPFFAWAGLRPPIAQHTIAEHYALEKHARGCKSLVEIGVAEGASAVALRTSMDPEGTLYLVDPFHLSRVRTLNFLRRAARRAVSAKSGRKTVWIEAFSHEAVASWNLPIDFLLIDGDHRKEAVEQDWNDWHPYMTENGIIAFHDARLFPGGWTSSEYGPVRFVNRVFRTNHSSSWEILEEADSLVFVRKRQRGST